MHVSGGREVKQWDPQRFADVAQRLVSVSWRNNVSCGARGDAPLIEQVSQPPAARFVHRCVEEPQPPHARGGARAADLMVTGDTGPMHVAAAVGTPIVAVFGPSDPRRYAPRGALDRVIRVDLPCAPCNRIRLPPARCTGHIPDCLASISADRVFEAASACSIMPSRNRARRPHDCTATIVMIRTAASARQRCRVPDAAAEEAAHGAGTPGSRTCGTATVDGTPFRQRFTVRAIPSGGSPRSTSTKQQVILDLHRALAARGLIARERPRAIVATRRLSSRVHRSRWSPPSRGVSVRRRYRRAGGAPSRAHRAARPLADAAALPRG